MNFAPRRLLTSATLRARNIHATPSLHKTVTEKVAEVADTVRNSDAFTVTLSHVSS
jgi:ribosome-associated translation inhibitor RaiA